MSEHDFVIEEVTDLDAAWPELEPLFQGQFDYHSALNGHRLLDDWQERLRVEMLRNPESVILVARDGDQAIGFLNGWLAENPFIYEERVGYIANVFVLADWRRRGAAQSLLSHAETWFGARGISDVQLNYYAANEPAEAFWGSMGFEIVSHRSKKTLGEAAS